MPEKDEEVLSSSDGISRRRMLKRIGAGAAVAWTAPVVTSLGSPAFAQTPVCDPDNCSRCFSCPDPDLGCPPHESQFCGGPEDCLDTAACLCALSIEGECWCGQNAFGSGDCTSSDQCLPNERCLLICGFNCEAATCIPACSSAAPRSKRRAGTPAARG